MAPVDREGLLRTLREAFLGDLGDHVASMEQGLLALERAGADEERLPHLRDVFRSAHGLKGAARAADLPAVEALCHAMESLLGEARDAGRLLGKEEFAALLAGVDALSAAEQALRDAPAASPDPSGLDGARARIEARVARRHDEATAPPVPAPAPATPAPPRGEPRDAPASRTVAGAGSAPEAEPGAGAPAGNTGRERQRPRAVRVPPERLDALATTGWALLLAARQAEQQAGRLDALVHELRRVRRELPRRAQPGRARAGSGPGPAPASASSVTARDAPRRATADERLRRVEREATAFRVQLSQDAQALATASRRLDEDVRSLRLVPWGDAAAGLDRTARDLASTLGKEVQVEVEGSTLELDHSVVAALREPLAHLVRNAVDHGLEPPADRERAGKPRRGLITLAAAVRGDRVRVRVTDDGRGLDPAELREAARRRGIPVPADDARILELVFAPGFSTASEVTAISGRGVGLDIVANAVRALRGWVGVESSGRGTSFELILPTTLYGVRALVVREDEQLFAVPSLDVARIVRAGPDQLRQSDGRSVLVLDAPLPTAPLATVLGLATGAWERRPHHLAVVLAPATNSRHGRAAVLVDEVVAERELSLEPLAGAVAGIRFAAGAALVAQGRLALVLRPEELVAALHGESAIQPAAAPPAAVAQRKRRILLADDAATTRALERSLLEAAGYEVVTAADGDQALAALEREAIDLLVSDVEMPGRDGFELTRAVRAAPRLAALPVILLTGRQSDDDRRRGLDAGADAYLVKSGFDQRQLLATVAQLLEGGEAHR